MRAVSEVHSILPVCPCRKVPVCCHGSKETSLCKVVRFTRCLKRRVGSSRFCCRFYWSFHGCCCCWFWSWRSFWVRCCCFQICSLCLQLVFPVPSAEGNSFCIVLVDYSSGIMIWVFGVSFSGVRLTVFTFSLSGASKSFSFNFRSKCVTIFS